MSDHLPGRDLLVTLLPEEEHPRSVIDGERFGSDPVEEPDPEQQGLQRLPGFDGPEEGTARVVDRPGDLVARPAHHTRVDELELADK